MSRNVRKVLGKTVQLANSGNQNLFLRVCAFTVGTTKLSSNNNYSTKVKKENFINIPKQLHNNKLMNIFVPYFKNYSSSSVNSNNNTTKVLNPVEYKGWSKEDVCSLLCTPEENGGASLTIEKVKPLYDAGFDGTALANIVLEIQQNKRDPVEETHKDFPSVSRSAIRTLVFWVDNLLKTRLYHLWTDEKVKERLCSSVAQGGAGLSQSEYEKLLEKGPINLSLLLDEPKIGEFLSQIRNITIINDPSRFDIVQAQIESSPSRYLQRLQDQHKIFGSINIKPKWTNGTEDVAAPFVDRHESILETIETIYTPDLSEKPKLTLVSTSMGMGKSTFLCFCIKQFLSESYLIEKFIFGDTLYYKKIGISKRLANSTDAKHCKRADFVNKLYFAYSIGHFIPFECGGAIRSIESVFLSMIEEHMNRMFVGVEIILEKGKNPVLISSLDQLITQNDVSHLLLRFSELIQLNAPKVNDLISMPSDNKGSHQLPLILLIDSFHYLNLDTSATGSLHRLGILWFSLRMNLQGNAVSPALIVSANSAPNQFKSKDGTFFMLKVVNLDLLFGASIFDNITYDLFQAFLNSSVINEFGEETNTAPVAQQLSPYLSRTIISILLLCSGNGRAIEKVYATCGLEITKMVQSELSNTNETFNYRNIFEKAKSAVASFAKQYSESVSLDTLNINTPYINLIKVMGVVMRPDTVILDDKVTIEDLQKIGWFVKTQIDQDAKVASYVGSFMLLNAFTENQVPELANIDQTETNEFKHIPITYNDLLTPYKKLEQVKHQGDHFEQTIAGSIWARYCIACFESNIAIGSLIPIGKVLPKKMIPPDCISGMISLKGVVKLNKQFTIKSSTDILPLNRVILNLDQSKFSDIILPISKQGKPRFIAIQTRYIKTGGSQTTPSRFAISLREVLEHPSRDFSFLFISTFIPDCLLDLSKPKIKAKQYIEENSNKFQVSEPTNLVSIWWHLLMYKHNPDKRKE